VSRGFHFHSLSWCRSLRRQPKATRQHYILGAGEQFLRPVDPLGWRSITNHWRERASPETCVRLSACLHEARKSVPLQSSCKTMSQAFSAQICAGDGDTQRYVDREGAYDIVRAHRAQSSSTPLRLRLNVIMTRLHGLIHIARNPYRPELHYMRGPGPKWYAKQGRTENGPFEGVAAQSSSRKRQ
jgi:hypothetical protein